MDKDQVLQIFRDCGAMLEGHFILSSGLRSPVFLQKARVFQYAEQTEKLCSALAERIKAEVPGVTTMTFLKTALNAVRVARGEDELDAVRFLKLVREKAKSLNITDDMLKRPLNVGFSGGEKKRAETLQMALLEPTFAVLDETDSGLDVDAMRVVAEGVNALRSPERSMLVITHYQRLLDHIVPDHVHILAGGKIVKSGPKELAREVEESGYADIKSDAA